MKPYRMVRRGWSSRRSQQLRLAAWVIAITVGALIGGLTAPFGVFPR